MTSRLGTGKKSRTFFYSETGLNLQLTDRCLSSIIVVSVADPGYLFRIPDLGSKIYPDYGSGSASKNGSIFNPKNGSKLSEKWSGMFIPDPGSRGKKSIGSRIRIRITDGSGHVHCAIMYTNCKIGSKALQIRRSKCYVYSNRNFFSHISSKYGILHFL